MRKRFKHCLIAIITVLLLINFSGCHFLFPDDEDPDPVYLVSYEMVRSYLPELVEFLFDDLVDQYPEMQPIRDRVKHGIIIYKITYKTIFNEETVVASGLVAVPTGEGPFPVISYQNLSLIHI